MITDGVLKFAIEQAQKELEQEEYEIVKAREKERLRRIRGRSIWVRLFPWRIRIERITHDRR